jgi:ATP-binding cassette subfamily F protein uup
VTLLLSVQNLTKWYGSQNIFTGISFSLCKGDRIGLIGPNGSGKSTLLKILSKLEEADEGHIAKRQEVKIAYIAQFPTFITGKTVKDIMLSFHAFASKEEAEIAATTWLHKAGFEREDILVDTLSGGWKKRLDVIYSLMQNPDILLLDEPTNHLDMEGIQWLEELLLRERKTYLIVSHDRSFLDHMCTKIIEINRCFPKGVFISEGNWSNFSLHKEHFLEVQRKEERSLSALAKEEVDWMNRSPKARTTKSKSRVERAHQLIENLEEVGQRNRSLKVGVEFVSSERETRHLIVATNIGKSLAGKQLFSGLNLKLSPGTRLGIVGKNGTGKSTLLKALAGEIELDKGTLKCAQDLRCVYFDQHREKLDPNITLKEALSPGGDFVLFQGESIHVHGWARRFLFDKERLNLPIHVLSGGERARILLARLMLKPADVLFLDEPTNDLDIPTLEVIEKSLMSFPGAVVIISHDRFLMDRLCTQIVGLGAGAQEVFPDIEQWQKTCKEPSLPKKEKEEKKRELRPSKLSYLEQKELDGIEQKILGLEEEISRLEADLENTHEPKQSLALYEKLANLQGVRDQSYERWQVLLDKTTKN